MHSFTPVEAEGRQKKLVEVLSSVTSVQTSEEGARSCRRRQSHLAPIIGQSAREMLRKLVAMLENHVPLKTDAHAAVCVTVAADERRADVVASLAHEAVGVRQRRLNQGEEFTINKRVEVGTATFDDALKTPTRV